MIIFLDTSSLLKLYHRECGTDDLLQFFAGSDTIVYLSEISKVEFCSAIWKKVRTKELSIEKAKEKINFSHLIFPAIRGLNLIRILLSQQDCFLKNMAIRVYVL